MNNTKKDNELMRILDLKEISRVICNTDKSYLTLKLRKGEKEYWLHLDSVPLSKEDNQEVMQLLFPKTETVPQVKTVGSVTNPHLDQDLSVAIDIQKKIAKLSISKPKGRSKKVK